MWSWFGEAQESREEYKSEKLAGIQDENKILRLEGEKLI